MRRIPRMRERGVAYCPHCGSAFLSLGLASHRAACQRKMLAARAAGKRWP